MLRQWQCDDERMEIRKWDTETQAMFQYPHFSFRVNKDYPKDPLFAAAEEEIMNYG